MSAVLAAAALGALAGLVAGATLGYRVAVASRTYRDARTTTRNARGLWRQLPRDWSRVAGVLASPCGVWTHLADFLSVLPSSWASEEDESLREKGLQKGYPVPNLATIKDFVRFYVSSTDEILTLRPTKSSVLNFAERFFAGYTRITKSVFDKKDSDDVYTVRNPSLEYLSMVTERK
ncbi:hypothetical protein GCM10020218_029570 [Dactylosporangium vinaceum]